jgi:hypothetical protein
LGVLIRTRSYIGLMTGLTTKELITVGVGVVLGGRLPDVGAVEMVGDDIGLPRDMVMIGGGSLRLFGAGSLSVMGEGSLSVGGVGSMNGLGATSRNM